MNSLVSVFYNSNEELISFLKKDKIFLYKNGELVYSKTKHENLLSVIFQGDFYLYTISNDNYIHGRFVNQTEEFKYLLNGYESLTLIKFLGNGNMVLIQAVNTLSKETKMFIYDLIKETVFVEFPDEIGKGKCYDMVFKNEHINVLGYFRENVSSYPQDDIDSEDIYLMTYKINGETLELTDKLSVICIYDDFDEKEVTITKSMNFMQFPLFSHFLYFWLEEKSFSASGKRVVYYSEDIHGLIISEIRDGEVYKLVSLPKYLSEEDFYYYNDLTGILSVVNECGIKRFKLVNSDKASGDEIEILNKKYKEAQAKNVNLQRHEDGFSFKRAFFRAIESTCLIECE